MLVLSRRSGESIVIGREIRVSVLAVCGHRVRVGVQAPGHVAVDREELWLRKQEHRTEGTPEAGLSRSGEAFVA
jgi:carbon storage regulator